jgi:fluoride ion exporter CrcB/FEX
MDIYLVVGVLGAFITLTAFVLNQFGKLDEKQFSYDLMNLISSTMLLTYALHSMVVPFIITNVVWGLVSLRDVVIYLIKKEPRKKRGYRIS